MGGHEGMIVVDPLTVPAVLGLLTAVVSFANKYLERRKQRASRDQIKKAVADAIRERDQWHHEYRERERERVERLEREVAELRGRRDRTDD